MSKIARFVPAAMKEEIKEQPVLFALYVVLRLIVVAVLVLCVLDKRYDYALLCGLVIVLLLIPAFLERRLAIDIPNVLEGIILLFIFAAEILGEIGSFYVHIAFWDTMLHTLWGFLAAGIGFALVDILNRSESSRLNLSPLYMAVMAFCFSMTMGALWELFEYSMDTFFGFDMQKDTFVSALSSVALDPANNNNPIYIGGIESMQLVLADGSVVNVANGYLDIGIHDTMEDLFVNLIGATTFAIIGFAYVKNRDRKNGKGSFAANFIPRLRSTMGGTQPRD